MGFLDRLFPRRAKGPKNPRLVRAIQAVAINDNPQTRRVLYQELLKSTFLIPTTGDMGFEKDKWTTLTEDTAFELITAQDPEGHPVWLIFTDSEALLAWKPEGCNYVAVRAADLFPLALQDNTTEILVNPAGPTGGKISRGEIEMLAEGGIPEPGNPDLAAAIQVFVNDPSPKNRATMYQTLAKGLLIIGVGEVPKSLQSREKVITVKEKVNIKLLASEGPGGMHVLAFTDVETLHARKPGCNYFGITAEQLFEMVLKDDYAGIIINSAGPWARIPREDIERLYKDIKHEKGAQ